jgi:hypothetical protein
LLISRQTTPERDIGPNSASSRYLFSEGAPKKLDRPFEIFIRFTFAFGSTEQRSAIENILICALVTVNMRYGMLTG